MSYQWNNNPNSQPIYNPNAQYLPSPQYTTQYQPPPPPGTMYAQPVYYSNGFPIPNTPIGTYPSNNNFYAPNPAPNPYLNPSLNPSLLSHSNSPTPQVYNNVNTPSSSLIPVNRSSTFPTSSSLQPSSSANTSNTQESQHSRRRDRFSSYLQSDRLLVPFFFFNF